MRRHGHLHGHPRVGDDRDRNVHRVVVAPGGRATGATSRRASRGRSSTRGSAVANPGARAAAVDMQFLRADGATASQALTVPALGMRSIDADGVAGLSDTAFATGGVIGRARGRRSVGAVERCRRRALWVARRHQRRGAVDTLVPGRRGHTQWARSLLPDREPRRHGVGASWSGTCARRIRRSRSRIGSGRGRA